MGTVTYTTEDGIDVSIHCSASFTMDRECDEISIEEVTFKDPDGVEWVLGGNSPLSFDLIDEDYVFENLDLSSEYESWLGDMIDHAYEDYKDGLLRDS